MARIKEEPLTTQALNTFFTTLHTELDKSDAPPDTKQFINSDVVEATLRFVGLTNETDPNSVLPTLKAKDPYPGLMMPATLSELRKRMEAARNNLDLLDDPATESAKVLFKVVADKALSAAEKEMSKAGLRSR